MNEYTVNERVEQIRNILKEAMYLDDKTFITGNSYDIDGKSRSQVIIRHGGEALKYDFSDEGLSSIKYTTHYFDKQNRNWTDVSKCSLKQELKKIYDILPYKSQRDIVFEMYDNFRKQVAEHSPKTSDGKQEIYCCNFNGRSFDLRGHKGEWYEIRLNSQGIENIDLKGSHTINGVTIEEINRLMETEGYDNRLAQYCRNAILILYRSDFVVEVKRNENIDKVHFITRDEAQSFADTLPKGTEYSIYDDDIFKEIDMEIEEEGVSLI